MQHLRGQTNFLDPMAFSSLLWGCFHKAFTLILEWREKKCPIWVFKNVQGPKCPFRVPQGLAFFQLLVVPLLTFLP